MGMKISCINQGQGVLQFTVPEYELTFLDSYKYFPQKLSSLPKRFQLEDEKGYFSHLFNVPEHWNIIRPHPPPLHYYINKQDSAKEKMEKEKWWVEVKNKESKFDFNYDAVEYCKKDVKILMAACTKFLQQTFQFGQQMIDRFGISSNWRQGLHHLYFHPFCKSIPTLGSYS